MVEWVQYQCDRSCILSSAIFKVKIVTKFGTAYLCTKYNTINTILCHVISADITRLYNNNNGHSDLVCQFHWSPRNKVLVIVKVIGNVQKYWKVNKLELSLFSSLTSDAMLITPTVYLLNCVKINYVYFIIKLCCDQLWTRVSLCKKHDGRDTLVHRNLLKQWPTVNS